MLDPSLSPEKMKWAVAFKAPFRGTLGYELCEGTVAELEARTSSSEVCISLMAVCVLGVGWCTGSKLKRCLSYLTSVTLGKVI